MEENSNFAALREGSWEETVAFGGTEDTEMEGPSSEDGEKGRGLRSGWCSHSKDGKGQQSTAYEERKKTEEDLRMVRMGQVSEEGHGRGCISGQLLPTPIASMQNQRIPWNDSTAESKLPRGEEQKGWQ